MSKIYTKVLLKNGRFGSLQFVQVFLTGFIYGCVHFKEFRYVMNSCQLIGLTEASRYKFGIAYYAFHIATRIILKYAWQFGLRL